MIVKALVSFLVLVVVCESKALPKGPVDCSLVRCAKPLCDKPRTPRGACCPVCRRCYDDVTNRYYRVGSAVPRKDPCLSCRCTAQGTILCASIACALPICEGGVGPIQVPGKCCPQCPPDGYCYDKRTEKHYKPGESVPTSNPCEHCTCGNDGEIFCAIQDCAYPHCENDVEPRVPPGQCCPICPPSCLYKGDGKTYYAGDVIPQDDPCAHCKCDWNGGIQCTIQSCPLIKCAPGYISVVPEGKCCPECQKDCRLVKCAAPQCAEGIEPVVPEGECCPVCPCLYKEDGKTYYPSNDRLPHDNPCVHCRCEVNGIVKCAIQSCPAPNCPPGNVPVTPEGQCCAECQRDCSAVSCLKPICVDGAKPIVPPGECCPVCPPPDCSTVLCLLPVCSNGVKPVVPKGQCCPKCPKPNCSLVFCPAIALCSDGEKPVIPEGECCPQC